MKTHIIKKIITVALSAVLLASMAMPACASYIIDSPIGDKIMDGENGSAILNTQFAHSTYRVSWLRDLIVNETADTIGGIASRADIIPKANYPYSHTAATFKSEVDYYTKLYTLDENSQKAAYLYFFKQLDIITILSEDGTTDFSKKAYLEEQGIVIPDDIDTDPNGMLMVSALYALMKNDLYYVYTGGHITIPAGTPLEEALMTYVMAMSNQSEVIGSIQQSSPGVNPVESLDSYVYYTSLAALVVNGKASIDEVSTLSEDEVNRRIAIMAIEKYGIAIDGETASDEEIRIKYMAAALGEQYNLTIDNPAALQSAYNSKSIPFYLLQLMGLEDAGLTITSSYIYEDAFTIILLKTHRFDLEHDFYSDIYEYDIPLKNRRDYVFIRVTPLSSADAAKGSKVKLTLSDGSECANDKYQKVELPGVAAATESIRVTVEYLVNGSSTSRSVYKINFIQGAAEDTSAINLSDVISKPSVPGLSTTGRGGLADLDPSDIYAMLNGLVTVPESVLAEVTGMLAERYSTDQYGNFIDEQGNIMFTQPETLADGYQYVTYEDGSFEILPIVKNSDPGTTSPITTEKSPNGGAFGILSDYLEDWEALLVISCAIILVSLIVALIIIKRRNKKAKKEESVV